MIDIDEAKTDELLKGIFIPSCPAVLTELMRELREPLTNGKRVAALIGKDPGLAAGVVKSANSPLFGTRRKIGSVAEAIKLLGYGTLSGLVIETLLRTSIGTPDASLERFWDNSAHTAAISAHLATIVGGTRADTAYTFGLLLDCGIPLMVQRFGNYKSVLKTANEALDRSFTAVEDAELGTNHAVIGFILARSWGLPDAISEAVLSHHDVSVFARDSGLADESCALIGIRAIAEHVAGLHLRLTSDAEWTKARTPVAGFFGYSLTEIDDLVDDLLFKLDSEKNRAPA